MRDARPSAASGVAKLAVELSAVSFGAIGGSLLRQGMSEWISRFAVPPVIPEIGAHMLGTYLLGFVLGLRSKWDVQTTAFYLCVGVGFCGSLTTFSSWMYQAAIELADLSSVDVGIFILLIGLMISPSSYLFGNHSLKAIGSLKKKFASEDGVVGLDDDADDDGAVDLDDATFSPESSTISGLSRLDSSAGTGLSTESDESPVSANEGSRLIAVCEWILILFNLAACVSLILLIVFQVKGWVEYYTVALFGVIGASTRWQLSRSNQVARFKGTFPIGTFVANVTGTLLLSIFKETEILMDSSGEGMQALWFGLTSGLCGCLSTVSTWVAELFALNLINGYLYGAASVIAGCGCAWIVVVIFKGVT